MGATFVLLLGVTLLVVKSVIREQQIAVLKAQVKHLERSEDRNELAIRKLLRSHDETRSHLLALEDMIGANQDSKRYGKRGWGSPHYDIMDPNDDLRAPAPRPQDVDPNDDLRVPKPLPPDNDQRPERPKTELKAIPESAESLAGPEGSPVRVPSMLKAK